MYKFYCNKCLAELEEESACGSVSYFCPVCKGLVSRSMMLTEAQRNMKMEQNEDGGEQDA